MSYWRRVIGLLVIDFVLLFIAALGALVLRFSGEIPTQYVESFKTLVLPTSLINLGFLYLFGIYKKIWQYASIGELISIIQSMTMATILIALANEFGLKAPVPFTVYLITWVLKIVLIGGSRFSWRIYREKGLEYLPHHKNALIVGAGTAGGIVIKEILNNHSSDIYPVGFVDDAESKQRLQVLGFPILGKSGDIPSIAKNRNVQEIIIAMPSASKAEIKRIFEICKTTGAKLKILPAVFDLISGKVRTQKLREVAVEDLLGREPVRIDLGGIAGYLKGQVVVVTGAGGSIGSELCRQVATFNPKKLILLGHGENSIYEIELELRETFPNVHIQTEICDVQDKHKIDTVFSKNKPNVVFHAAAHKHVPLMERNPEEAVKNNVLGTKNVAEAADRVGVKTFVLVSTDKAVNPTSVMGATKRVAEMVIQNLDKVSKTKFVAVRFGNVLGSRGSVIPLFKKQIAKGGPVTVTDPEMVRFFMTIPEAVQLVIQAGSMAGGGEVFILDMGKPVKIADLAYDLIRLSGYEPGKDIEVKFTGIRPGEKLYEELLTSEEGTTSTKHQRIFVGKPNNIDVELLEEFIAEIRGAERLDPLEVVEGLRMVVPSFQPQNKAFRVREVS